MFAEVLNTPSRLIEVEGYLIAWIKNFVTKKLFFLKIFLQIYCKDGLLIKNWDSQ